MNAKRIRQHGLAGPQIRFEERVLNGEFTKIIARLDSAPEPRNAWYSRQRRDGRVPHPAHDAVLYCRSAMHAAIETGDTSVIDDTRLQIVNYFERCMAAAIDVGAPLTERVTVADVVAEECEAISAVVAAKDAPSAGALATAREKMRRMIDGAQKYLRMADTEERRNSAGIRW